MVAFFDTNLLVYCTDATAPYKLTSARSLVARASTAGEATAGGDPRGGRGWLTRLMVADDRATVAALDAARNVFRSHIEVNSAGIQVSSLKFHAVKCRAGLHQFKGVLKF